MRDRAKNMANLVGWIFLALVGMNSVATMYNYDRVWNCWDALCLPIAIGIFARWQWARILGILYALFRSVPVVIVMIGQVISIEDYTGTISSRYIPQQFLYFFLGIIVLVSVLLVYVLFRPDVRELFRKKDPEIVSNTVVG